MSSPVNFFTSPKATVTFASLFKKSAPKQAPDQLKYSIRLEFDSQNPEHKEFLDKLKAVEQQASKSPQHPVVKEVEELDQITGESVHRGKFMVFFKTDRRPLVFKGPISKENEKNILTSEPERAPTEALVNFQAKPYTQFGGGLKLELLSVSI